MTPIPVLFLQSQTFYGADSALHALLLRHFDRARIRPHVAANLEPQPNPAASAYPYFAAIPDCPVLPTDFGPSLFDQTRAERIRRAAGGAARVPVTLLRLARYIRSNHIRVLHGTEKPRDAFYGVLLGKLTGAKSVVHMHINYGDWQTNATKWALRHCDGIIGVSRFTAASLVRAGFPEGKVFAVPNCLDARTDVWNPDRDGEEVRAEFGIPAAVPVIGVVARLFAWKGHADLVEAVARLRASFPDVRLVIVGEDDPRGHPGGGSFRAELEARVAKLNMTENVVFTGFRTDAPRLFAAFDVYAMPTWEEPFGMVFLEAAAMRVPVVACFSGGVPEAVADNETGLLVPSKNVPALADALARLLSDPALRAKFGAAGRARVLRDFSPARMCENVAGVYAELLAAPAGARRGEPSEREAAA